MPGNIYSPLLHQALEFASAKHDGQYRKHPIVKIPYIAHPALVGLTLSRLGYSDEVVAAGFLHDVVEDCGVALDEIKSVFSSKVADLVDQVSEPEKNISWHARKDAYRKKMRTADLEAVAIAAADHLHNLHSLNAAFDINPESVNIFGASLKEKLDNEGKLVEIFKRRLPGALVNELEQAYKQARSKML
ncbi:MAG TPA: HD domain-containing protein [bacterium]|nr:MAG: GTP pyrophosphokinase [Parcubacteria group bacterium ADurb.Bin192]HPN14857.1 HD domain-containing protein [bacterium]